ncbi:MAG: histidine kinase [Roseiflexaceae bacterium]
MNLQDAHPVLAEGGLNADSRRAADPRLRGLPLVLVRTGWAALTVLALLTFAISVPMYNAQLQTLCVAENPDTSCMAEQLAPQHLPALEASGFSLATYASYLSAIRMFAELVSVVVALIIFWRKSNDPMALLVSMMLALSNGLDPAVAPTWARLDPALQFVDMTRYGLGAVSVICFLYLFPDGGFAPRWTRWVLAVYLLSVLQLLFEAAVATDLRHVGGILTHPVFGIFAWGGTLLTGVGSQVYRYWRVSGPTQRQQTKWVVFGIVLFLVLTSPTSLPLSWNERGALGFIINRTANSLIQPMIAITIAIAIFRYRLWDIDPIINRTLVYGALTALVAGIYVLVVGYLGTVFRASGSLAISLIATTVVAVLFQPLRDRLQRGVNRLMYGERDEPYAVIARLGHRLESTFAPDSVLPTIVETVREALKLPYTAIALATTDDRPTTTDQRPAATSDSAFGLRPSSAEDGFRIVASSGTLVANLLCLPLVHQGETIGQLLLAPRAQGETFSPADRRLLDDLARQAGIAVHAVRLTADLLRSRQRLVNAREEERRRLRRDLHDGLGAMLAALNLQAGTIRSLMSRDPAAADALMVELRTEIRAAIADIRRLVYDLRPPALDELGLVGAIRARAAQCHTSAGRSAEGGALPTPDEILRVIVDASEQLPALPAAVEVATYRIVQEALTNVARHARARTCVIRLDMSEGLRLEIADDGIGLPAEGGAGVGLRSMRERAAELGGTCVIQTRPQGGMQVLVQLPLPPAEEESHGSAADSDRR